MKEKKKKKKAKKRKETSTSFVQIIPTWVQRKKESLERPSGP